MHKIIPTVLPTIVASEVIPNQLIRHHNARKHKDTRHTRIPRHIPSFFEGEHQYTNLPTPQPNKRYCFVIHPHGGVVT